MKIQSKRLSTLIQSTFLIVSVYLFFFFLKSPYVLAAHPAVNLLTTLDFAVLAGSAIVDTTPSIITGKVGLSPASGTFNGITCPEVTGTIYSVDSSGPLPCRVEDAGTLTQAKNDLTIAYNEAASSPTTSTIGTELGGQLLVDGTYDSASTTFEIVSGGTLTLDGAGNADSVFIFKMASTLVTFSNSNVVLINGAQACNVFWQVGSSATLGTGTNFVGTVLADQSITDNGSSTITGRLLASVAAVTLNDTTINTTECNDVVVADTDEDDDDEDDDDEDDDETEKVAPKLPNTGFSPYPFNFLAGFYEKRVNNNLSFGLQTNILKSISESGNEKGNAGYPVRLIIPKDWC